MNRVDYLWPLIKLESVFPSETLKIFTLNYDLSVELACKRLNVSCSDGFSDGAVSYNSVPIFSDTTGSFADVPLAVYNWEGETEKYPARVELFKLHGSVNWFEEFPHVEKGNLYDVYRQIRKITNAVPFSARTISGPLAKVNSMSDQVMWWSGDDDASLYFPRLVFGTTIKYLPTVPFARMYELMYRYLRRSRLCLIVGYSFQDAHVNGLLFDAFNKQCDRFAKKLNVVIIDSSDRQMPHMFSHPQNNSRVWRIIGPASAALTSKEFEELCYELAMKGSSNLPHRIEVTRGVF